MPTQFSKAALKGVSATLQSEKAVL